MINIKKTYTDEYKRQKEIFQRKILSEQYLYSQSLTHSASELSGFTCKSSLTMNEKSQYRTRPPRAVLKISSSLLVNSAGKSW